MASNNPKQDAGDDEVTPEEKGGNEKENTKNDNEIGIDENDNADARNENNQNENEIAANDDNENGNGDDAMNGPAIFDPSSLSKDPIHFNF